MESVVLDDLDRSLLAALQSDARQSYRTLASVVGSTVPTVSTRVKRMEELGIIQGYTVVLDGDRFERTDVGDAKVACHTCQQSTTQPHYWRGDGRLHPFCCPVCKARFIERFERSSQAR